MLLNRFQLWNIIRNCYNLLFIVFEIFVYPKLVLLALALEALALTLIAVGLDRATEVGHAVDAGAETGVAFAEAQSLLTCS